ncbi:unnamed protein product [Chironomus riparius]|uniref:Uncharacterized protein n=1 Tax=Chironomus riparius TaxID=315576 RepID=A0A9P0NEX3_9DIPT|nr:unnamed protein product [Chironomus riparius]
MDQKTKTFVKPEDFLKIQIRKQQLQQRLKQKSKTTASNHQENDLSNNNVFDRKKRPNPFARDTEQNQKKSREDSLIQVDDTIFELIHNTTSKPTANLEAPILEVLNEYEKNIIGIVQENTKEEPPQIEILKFLPVDWSIKRCIRILSKTIVTPSTLKSSVEASGLTGFVRCLDIKNTSSGLDISSSARFHQNLMYWQSPHLPWLNLVQRNSSNNNPFKLNENEVDSLYKDWMNSFKNLFNLLRARQCPYFYVLANNYNILFRAAGIGGRAEMHALLTPTSKGFRQMLNDEEIEFTQPLKKSGKKSLTPNNSIEGTDENNEEEEVDEMAFLEELGINKTDIKFKENIKEKQRELEDDHVHTLTTLLSELKDNYNLTMSNYLNTIAFTKVSKELINDLDTSQTFADNVFGVENLSDCGIDMEVLKTMCSVKSEAINITERLQYCRKLGGFTHF